MSFLLGDVGYETIILKAPPTGAEELLRDVNLLLVAPGLREEQREANLAILRGTEEGLRVPVFAFSSAVEASVFAEDAGSSWPVAIGNLARAIEAALGGGDRAGRRGEPFRRSSAAVGRLSRRSPIPKPILLGRASGLPRGERPYTRPG
jgi:hypothetical protein